MMHGAAQRKAADHDGEVVVCVAGAVFEDEVGEAVGPLDGGVEALG